MKTDPEPLLCAVLGETAEARSATLQLALTGARHRRRARAVRRAAVAMLGTIVVSLALWPRPPGPSLAKNPEVARLANPLIVHTAPLPDDLLVDSRAGTAETIRSETASVGRVRTSRSEAGYHAITDDELMALVAGRPAALVTVSGRKQLVFAGYAGWPSGE